MNAPEPATSTVYPFDARGIGGRFRHAAVFGALEALQPGEGMRFVNDHDPLALLAQLRERYGDAIRIDYRQRMPGGTVIDFTMLADAANASARDCCGGCG